MLTTTDIRIKADG